MSKINDFLGLDAQRNWPCPSVGDKNARDHWLHRTLSPITIAPQPYRATGHFMKHAMPSYLRHRCVHGANMDVLLSTELCGLLTQLTTLIFYVSVFIDRAG